MLSQQEGTKKLIALLDHPSFLMTALPTLLVGEEAATRPRCNTVANGTVGSNACLSV